MIHETCEEFGHDDAVVYKDRFRISFECTRCKDSGTVYLTADH